MATRRSPLCVPNDHPAIFIYVMGGERSRLTAINQIVGLTEGLLSPPYTIGQIRMIAKTFLIEKKEEHHKGLIKVKEIY